MTMEKLTALLALSFFLANFILSCLVQAFVFNGFKQAAPDMTMDEFAMITPKGVLQLTNNTLHVVGHAFYSTPFTLFANTTSKPQLFSFTTHFVFSIVSSVPGQGGHGMAFVLAPTKKLPINSSGPFLGFVERSGNGLASNHILAIEFDTASSGFGDIDDNHVGIDINGVNSNLSRTAEYNNSYGMEVIKLDNSELIQAWVEYDGNARELKVTISPSNIRKPREPLLVKKELDLSTIVKESMYVGFTAATGKAISTHCVFGWSFEMGTELAQDLDLSQLPSLKSIKQIASFTKNHELIVAVAVSSIATIVLLALVIFGYKYIVGRVRLRDEVEDWELEYPHRFRYKDLHVATRGFNESEILGRGGFGCVYKGVMPSTKEVVAIKRISPNSNQGLREFVAEIASLGRMRHRNLVHLIGWCKWKGDLLIAYEYMPNGSLADFLLGSNHNVLSWKERFVILKGVASALLYLHEGWEQVVVHRDVKPGNVLLDASMNARLGDFGLARLYDHGSNPLTTHIVGTLGYMAPEISRTGKATPGSDVYAYGILLLEVACGRMPIDAKGPQEQLHLLDWVHKCCGLNKILDAMDPKLENDFVVEEAELVLKLGLICSHLEADARPSMRQVYQYLDGNDLLPEVENQSEYYFSSFTGRNKHYYGDGASSSYPSSYGAITNSLGSGR